MDGGGRNLVEWGRRELYYYGRQRGRGEKSSLRKVGEIMKDLEDRKEEGRNL